MIKAFPVVADNTRLTAEDYSRFSNSYAEILKYRLPTVEQVVFAITLKQVEDFFQQSLFSFASELVSLCRKLMTGSGSFAIFEDFVLLPFELDGGGRSVAIISGADPLFIKKVSEDWLLETRTAVEREFLLIKQARVDSQTGLLNVSNLQSLLDTYGSNPGLQLILLELPPRRTSFQYFGRYTKKCATLLQNYVLRDSVLHYLGQFTFGLVLQHNAETGRSEFESYLVNHLKREGCHRVHVGSSMSDTVSEGGRQLLDQAWTALRHAAKRGPFSFCDFAQLAHPENHPLLPPDRNLGRRLSRFWSRADSFTLVQFSSDNVAIPARDVVVDNIDQGEIVVSGDDVYVFFEGKKGPATLEWAQQVIKQSGNPDENIHVSAGVSNYPYGDFKKSETLFNCRKALLHAAFYGKASAAIFDPVSLNISGDIYFADGDLAKAVKEYTRGLKCDPQDVNLHNSLGVALALMNKLPAAMLSFEKGLAQDNRNFMALYNLGLGEQARGQKAEALTYLEKALQNYSDEDGGAELVHDLTLQLGILSCELGKYEVALGYLQPWLQVNSEVQNSGRVHYYLGVAYYGLNDNTKAMVSLQHALRFDELDDRAMNLLGRIYHMEGEGDDIALSLCKKSVELEPANFYYLLYLAEVQLKCGLLLEARENLHRCLKVRSCKQKAQLFLGESYLAEEQLVRAKGWFEKVLSQGKKQSDSYERAQKGLKIISKKRKAI